MMNSTWLSRKIKGPNSEGDPVKKKKGVKPYQPIDMADYKKRQQMYSDSLSANIATENVAKTMKSQIGGDWSKSFIFNQDGYSAANQFYKDSSLKGASRWKGIGSSINEVKRTNKSLGISDIDSIYRKKRESGERSIWFRLPDRPKPKQKILPPPATKMPIGKLKSKSSTPKKLESRQNMKMYEQTVMGASGKREPAYQYQKRKGLSDEQMYRSFPGLKPDKTK